MAVYGAGRSRFLADYTKEKNIEQARLEAEYEKAMRARQVESKRKSWWSAGLSALGAAVFGPVGLAGGYALGKALGGAGTYGGQEVESIGMTTDKEKFGKWHKEEGASRSRTRQRELETIDREDWQGDLVDIAKVGGRAYLMGGGKLTDPSDFSFTKWGGQETGAGSFGFSPGGGDQSIWGRWMGKDIKPLSATEKLYESYLTSGTGDDAPLKGPFYDYLDEYTQLSGNYGDDTESQEIQQGLLNLSRRDF